MKTPETIEDYRIFVKKKLDELIPVFAQTAIGNFSVNTTIPENEDEFTGVFVGIQLIIEVVREQLSELHQLNHNLENKVEERTKEVAAKQILLQAQTNLYETLLRSQSQMGIGVIITEGPRIIYLNEAVNEIYGYTEKELKHLPSFLNIIAPELQKEYSERLKKRLEGNSKSDSGEIDIIKKDGNRITIEYSVKQIMSDGKQQMISVIRDISRKKQTEEILRAEKERAEKAEMGRKVAEMFLANISHEIRTPMNAIMGFSQLLESSQMTIEQKRLLQIILRSGNHLLGIINDILDLTKLESEKIQFDRTDFSILTVAETVKEIVSEKAIEKNNKIILSIDPELKNKICGDSRRLQQILLNLVSNSIKFTENGKIKITATLNGKEKKSREVLFEVKDSGCGIAEDELPFIFDRFRSMNNFSNLNAEGTGIGLTIVKQLVEQQGGKISIITKPGKGTTFRFKLTFSLSAKKELFQKTALQTSNRLVGKKSIANKKILIVEDNLMNMELVKILLEKWEIKFICAFDGKEALEKIETEYPDLILLDLKLPDIDGHEIARRIRKMKKIVQPKIIALTAHAIEGEREKCYKSGMNGFISKPFSPELLRLKITDLLQGDYSQTKIKSVVKNKIGAVGSFTDLTYLTEIAGNNEKEFRKILNLFIHNAPVITKEIELNFTDGNFKQAHSAIHKLKSGASTVLIKKYFVRLEKIEKMFAGGNKTNRQKCVKELQTIISGATRELRVFTRKKF